MPEFVIEPEPAGYANIKVVGVGGGGCNAVDWMFDTGLQNVEFFCLNTDAQSLKRYKSPNKIQVGTDITKGRGSGGHPEVGEKCMEGERQRLEELLKGADIVFVAAGLGGGTGTGGAPVVAQVARSLGILTVGVVTKPFRFEGVKRLQAADLGLEKLRKECDTIITVSNDRLLEVAGAKATLREAFGVANRVLSQGVQSISDLVSIPGLINVDFNDIRSVMGDRGGAVMGISTGKGENRASEAVKKATSSPLLDKFAIDGAQGVLVNITGGSDMTIGHVHEAMNMVYEMVDSNALIIFGAVVDDSVKDEMRVTLIATGFSDEPNRQRQGEGRNVETIRTVPQMLETTGAASSAQARDSAAAHSAAGVFETPIIASISETRSAADQAAISQVQPARPRTAGGGGSLRQSLDAMRQDVPGAPMRPPVQQPQAYPQNAPSAMPGADAPVRRPAQGGDVTFGMQHPEMNILRNPEEKPRIPVYSPAEPAPAAAAPAKAGAVGAEAEDYETPSFLRRRRSALFD